MKKTVRPEEPESRSRVRPVRWLQSATGQEIAIVLLEVDPEKAVEVAAILLHRLGPEVGRRVEAIANDLRVNPAETLVRACFSVLKGR